MHKSITVPEALDLLKEAARPLQAERIALTDAAGRRLARPIQAPRAHPPHDNSAMDGYGVKAADCATPPVTLRVVGTLYAGDEPTLSIEPGEAVGIMTGAFIPPGVDAVVPVEQTRETNEGVIIEKGVQSGQHIRLKGEDYAAGENLLSPGTRLTPPNVALIASLGFDSVEIYTKPQVFILPTGNELAAPGAKGAEEAIFDSNSFGLAAQVEDVGGIPTRLPIGRDDPERLAALVQEGLEGDLLLVSGGVSMGKADHIRPVIERLGGEIHFFKVRQRPGHPLAYATIADKSLFLLPGNPVSSMLCFEIYVRPFLLARMGADREVSLEIPVRLGETIRVKRGRTYFLRVLLIQEGEQVVARLTGPQGSGILTSLVRADALLVVPEEVVEIPKGTTYPVRLLSWRSGC